MSDEFLSSIVLIVTNSEGKASGLEGTIAAKEKSVEGGGNTLDPYVFYAAKTPDLPPPEVEEGEPEPTDPNILGVVVEVFLVLPIGGMMSGLFRYPLIGDKILAVKGSDGYYYLMGYLPDSTIPFNEKVNGEENLTEILDNKAIALRYKRTGDNPSLNKEHPPQYSEISISKQVSQYATTNKDVENRQEVDDGTGTLVKTDYPYLDAINISSTGDIYSNSENLNTVLGQRLLLKSTYLTDTIDAANATETTPASDGTIASGSVLKQSSTSFAGIDKGDISIDADHRLLLNARSGIVLSVGGAKITLTPSTISMAAHRLDGNPLGDAYYDSTLLLSSTAGIFGTARTIALKAGRSFLLSDSYGGMISSCLGRLSMVASAINMAAVSTFSKITSFLTATTYMLQNVATAALSKNGAGEDTALLSGNYNSTDLMRELEAILSFVNSIGSDVKKKGGGEAPSNSDLVGSVFSLIFDCFDVTRTSLLNYVNTRYVVTYNKKAKKYDTEDMRLEYVLALEICEVTLNIAIMTAFIVSARSSIFSQGAFSLTPKADAAINVKKFTQVTTEKENVGTPAAALALQDTQKETNDSEDNNASQTSTNSFNDLDDSEEVTVIVKKKTDDLDVSDEPDVSEGSNEPPPPTIKTVTTADDSDDSNNSNTIVSGNKNNADDSDDDVSTPLQSETTKKAKKKPKSKPKAPPKEKTNKTTDMRKIEAQMGLGYVAKAIKTVGTEAAFVGVFESDLTEDTKAQLKEL